LFVGQIYFIPRPGFHQPVFNRLETQAGAIWPGSLISVGNYLIVTLPCCLQTPNQHSYVYLGAILLNFITGHRGGNALMPFAFPALRLEGGLCACSCDCFVW